MPDRTAAFDGNAQRASKLDTTSISDALDRLGIAGQCLKIKPLDHRFRLAGRAFTLLYGPARTPPGTVGDQDPGVRSEWAEPPAVHEESGTARLSHASRLPASGGNPADSVCAWPWYQLVPHDVHDWDQAAAPAL